MALLRFLRLEFCSSEFVFLVFAFLFLVPVSGLKRQAASVNETVTFNVLVMSKLRPDSSGQAFEERAASQVAAQNVSQATALAKIVHRYRSSLLSDRLPGSNDFCKSRVNAHSDGDDSVCVLTRVPLNLQEFLILLCPTYKRKPAGANDRNHLARRSPIQLNSDAD